MRTSRDADLVRFYTLGISRFVCVDGSESRMKTRVIGLQSRVSYKPSLVCIQNVLRMPWVYSLRLRMVDTPLTYCIQLVKRAVPTMTNVDVIRGREVS